MIGKSIKVFDELDSTNTFVKNNVANLENGAIIVAKKQTHGRGRRDNKWVSDEGNLYFSILMTSKKDRNTIFKQIVQSSVSIVRTLNHFKVKASIKYPNDCLVGKKKISGVLIESSGSSKIDYIVIGIGININQINFCDLDEKATSMKQNLKKEIDVGKVLSVFIKYYNQILECNYVETFNEYIKKSVVINKVITYNNEDYKIVNIEEDGSLIIKNSSAIEKVAFNEISLKELY